MRACVLGHLLGENLNLICDLESDSFRWAHDIPDDAWVLGDANAELSIDTLLRLQGQREVTRSLDDAQSKAFMLLSAVDSQVDRVKWRLAMPKDKFFAGIRRLLDEARRARSSDGCAYYTDVFRRTRGVLRALESVLVDRIRLDLYLSTESNPTVRTTLESCRPADDGFLTPPTYDQLATVTGRLVISTGPRILTLNKRYRDIFVSRYPGGKMVLIDYRSLEPRISLAIAGRDASVDDVYEDIKRNVFDEKMPRDRIKTMTIALLYGAQEETMERVSGLTGRQLAIAIDGIESYVGIGDSRARLVKEFEQEGSIKNFYGRKIVPRKKTASLLYNNYIQSSAVDVALLGFANGIDLIKRQQLRIHPAFVIVDAAMFDVHPDDLGYLEEVADACGVVPGFNVKFKVKCEDIDGQR